MQPSRQRQWAAVIFKILQCTGGLYHGAPNTAEMYAYAKAMLHCAPPLTPGSTRAVLRCADTVGDLGFATELGNYGEYSGAPNTAETYAYAKTVLECATANPDGRGRALLVGGGIANFTGVSRAVFMPECFK